MKENFGFEKDLDSCLEVLVNGGLILYPTDTVWGIGCDATNEKAAEKIYRLKERPDQKAMIILAGDAKELSKYVSGIDKGVFDYLDETIKPTTLIFPNAKNLAGNLLAADGSIAIRIPRDLFCLHLLRAFGKPVVSTSANKSGEAAPGMFAEISAEIKRGVDYIVKYRQKEASEGIPSTVTRWENGKPVIIRP